MPVLNFGVKLRANLAAPPALEDDDEKVILDTVHMSSSEEIAYVIGKNGANIKTIADSTSTTIVPSSRGDPKTRILVKGPTSGVQEARAMIERTSAAFKKRKEQVIVRMEVPVNVVGAIIGPKGIVLQHVQNETRTHIRAPRKGESPFFEITGLPTDVKSAQDHIRKICSEYSTYRAGATPANHGLEPRREEELTVKRRHPLFPNWVPQDAYNYIYVVISATVLIIVAVLLALLFKLL
ncbi:hypothetical protein AAVH_12441 [Aphelenchoides avenae]|nr:hypothetical protein AAVH_12441 [Aphelenchus avenae]